jgi:prepilin-type processing-associated H-X9-DG protein
VRSIAVLAVVVIMVSVLGALLIPAVAKVREAAARTQCVSNLSQIGFAAVSYHDSHKHFPLAGEQNAALLPQERLSWFVSIGPYVESTYLYLKADRTKGWNAEENRYLALTGMGYVQCPGYPDRLPESTLMPTHYVGIAGLGVDAAALAEDNPDAGFFGYERKLSFDTLKRPSSTVLVAVETLYAHGAWSASGPPTARGVVEDSPYLGADGQFGGIHAAGANALFADCSVQCLNESVDPRLFKAMATMASNPLLE